jgi:hypothetical protein
MRGIRHCGSRADNSSMRRLRHATWPHALLFGYALIILCAMLVVGGGPGF